MHTEQRRSVELNGTEVGRDVVLMGPPGAGKGTQAKRVAADLRMPHVATGDLFRDADERDTALGREAHDYMQRGELVPDQVTIAMLLERLGEPDAAHGALLDGFPRTVPQAKALDEALTARGRDVGVALYLAVPREVLLQRLAGRWLCRKCHATYHVLTQPPTTPGRCDRCGGDLHQRADDRVETAEHRLDVYLAQTVPVVDYYRSRGTLVEVDGNQRIEIVQSALRAALGERGYHLSTG